VPLLFKFLSSALPLFSVDDAAQQKDAAAPAAATEQPQQQPGPSMRFMMTQYYSE
jgi:hypothetical protein